MEPNSAPARTGKRHHASRLNTGGSGDKKKSKAADMDGPLVKKRASDRKVSFGKAVPLTERKLQSVSNSEPVKPKSILKRRKPTTISQTKTKSKPERVAPVVESADVKPASRLTKRDMRIRRQELKLKKHPHYADVLKAKRIWEQLRNRNQKTNKTRKAELTEELYQLVAGKVKQMIYAHDAVRILQCLMALKNADIRARLFEEVKDEVVKMSKSKYAKFFVIKMLQYGTPQQRTFIINSLFGQIPHLIRHRSASDVVEYAYNYFANALQRAQFASEFYASHFVLFKLERPLSFEAVLAENPDKKVQMLDSLRQHLMQLADKACLRHSFVHRLFADFLRNCEPNMSDDIVDGLKLRLAEILHTRDGALVAMYCVWRSTAKQRKEMVRSLKPFVVKACLEEHGHMVLLAIFDAVDDTRLVEQYIIKEIGSHLAEIVANKHGQKVLQYLLKRRDPVHFLPQVRTLLAQGDGNPYSKKDADIRASELLRGISPHLLTYIAANAKELLYSAAMLVLSVGLNAVGDKSKLFAAIASVAAEPFIAGNSDNFHVVEHPQIHFVLKQLLQAEKDQSNVECSLAQSLAATVSAEQLANWTSCNKGCFVLVRMFESGHPTVVNAVRDIAVLKAPKLRSSTFAGAKVLLEKVNSHLLL